MARLVVARDRGVRADDIFVDNFTFGRGGRKVRGDGDVLPDREAEDRVGFWESKAVTVEDCQCESSQYSTHMENTLHCDIVGNDCLLLELELLKNFRSEDCFGDFTNR